MNKRGMSLITLSVTIAVMIILVSGSVTVGIKTSRVVQETKFQSEISQIEILTSNYIRRNSGNDFEPYVWNVSSLVDYEDDQFEGETITYGNLNVYIVDLKKIDAEEVTDGLLKKGLNDRYLYSEQTGHIYYERGKKIGNKIYYRIVELEE